MSINIKDYQLPYETHDLYEVNFFSTKIRTIVTHTPSLVDKWISDTQGHPLVVGLDVEWLPNTSRDEQNPVAILQLCTERRCLIFQLIHAPFIPLSLINFLQNPNYTFTGVGIVKDVEKLSHDYGLEVANTVDLRALAPEGHSKSGLKTLAREILGKEVEKPVVIS